MARKANKNVVEPRWHPNFRVAEGLPDIKAIRTDFLLNFIGVTLVLALLAYVSYNEYGAYQLGNVVDDLERGVQSASASNNASLRRSTEFENLSVRVKEAVAFTAMKVSPTGLVSDVSESLPPEMLLSALTMGDRAVQQGRTTKYSKTITMAGNVAGVAAAQATQIVNDYVNRLAGIPALKDKVERVSLVSLQRNEEAGLFTFNILVELKP